MFKFDKLDKVIIDGYRHHRPCKLIISNYCTKLEEQDNILIVMNENIKELCINSTIKDGEEVKTIYFNGHYFTCKDDQYQKLLPILP